MVAKIHKLSNTVDRELTRYFIGEQRISEFAIARCISQQIPDGHNLYLASSLPVREMDQYAANDHNVINVGSNRGASGIDGTIATAAGYSSGSNKPVTLLIGDLAVLYDLNSLAMLQGLSHPMVVVILNNQGGGIFSFLPVAQFPENFEKFFGTPHHFRFQHAAHQFGLNYKNPKSMDEFQRDYRNALKADSPTIIEVHTDRKDNVRVTNQIRKRIRALFRTNHSLLKK